MIFSGEIRIQGTGARPKMHRSKAKVFTMVKKKGVSFDFDPSRLKRWLWLNFNSYTIRGRANSAKATVTVFAAIVAEFYARRKLDNVKSTAAGEEG